MWYDMVWYDMRYDMIYDMIWYDICYDMVLYEMIRYDMMCYNKLWYMIWYIYLLQLTFHLVVVVGRILQILERHTILQNEKQYTKKYKMYGKQKKTYKTINKYKKDIK